MDEFHSRLIWKSKMPSLISDEQLQQAGLTEQDARLELVCHLFDTNRLTLHHAANGAGLNRVGMESGILSREISVCWYTEEDLENEMKTVRPHCEPRDNYHQ